MVGVSLEESTVSESSLDASTAPTMATGDSTTDLSHDSPPPTPTRHEHGRRERSSTAPAETFVGDFSFLLRSNSRLKCDSYTGSQTVLYPLQEDSKDHALQHSDYAHNLSQNPSKLSESDIELRMLRERDTEKVKRSENKFYGFLRRGRLASRSEPKKRRSRSVDEIMDLGEPLQSTVSLADAGHSVQDHGPTLAPPPIKYVPITSPSSSRPLSASTITPKHANKTLPQVPPDTTTSTSRPAMTSTHVIGEPERPKPRKKTFFGISLPGSRHSSVLKSRPNTPHSAPDNSLHPRHQRKPDPPLPSPVAHRHDLSPIPLNDTTNFRWNGDVAGQRSQPSFDISEPDSGLGIETVVAKTKLVTIVSPPHRPHLGSVPDPPVGISPIPSRIGPGIEKSRTLTADDANRPRRQDTGSSGRTSPLMVLANLGGKKGKERERNVDGGKTVRVATPASASENDKGRESQNSNGRPGTNISGPMNLKVTRGRIKHGSFDFERPLSTSVGHPVRSTRWSTSGSYRTSGETDRSANGNGNGHLWNGPSSSTYPIQEERTSLTRSRSARESDRHHQDRDRGQPKIRFADETKGTQTRSRSPYDPRSRTQKPAGRGLGLFKNSSPPPTQANLPYRPEGGSWGRNTSKRAGLGSTGLVDGLPSFGTSVTSLQQNGDANGQYSRSSSPQITTLPMDRTGMKRHTGKGRSLDLGLELNWAPSRVKEEAVMDFSEMGVRSKWREEAEMKEFGRKKVWESFEQVLGENGYAKFREYVQRFDARLIPLDGPSGLTHKVKRLLETSAKGLDAKEKQELLGRLDRVAQHPR